MILRNTALNLAGITIPLAVSLVAIPVLVDGYGVERFGVITLLWAVLGYFGIFDLGLGKALTFAIARIRDSGRPDEIRGLAAQSSSFLGIVGVALGLLWFFLAPTLGEPLGNNGDFDIRTEAANAFATASLALPLVLISAALRGVMEAYQAFAAVMFIRILSGVLLFAAPIACLFLGYGLVGVAASTVGVRLVIAGIGIWICSSLLGTMRLFELPKLGTLKPLLTMGGWMTVTNVIGPIMGYADRLILGIAGGAAAAAYYGTTNDVVSKLWLLTGALTGVLFPEFARVFSYSNDRIDALCNKAQKLLLASVFPTVILLTLFSAEILSVWINPDFSQPAAQLLQVLAASMLISSMAQVPHTLVQASGRSDLTAFLSLLLLAPNLIAIYYAASRYGAIGVAWVWFIRICVEYVVSVTFVRTIRPAIAVVSFSVPYGATLIIVALVLAMVDWDGPIGPRTAGFVILIGTFIIVYWIKVLNDSERQMLRNVLRRLR